MKVNFKSAVLGCIVGATVASGVTVLGYNGTQNISATFKNIKIFVDGSELTPRDSAGNVLEPFIYNGSTYLPVRAVGEAVGKYVSYDKYNNILYLDSNSDERDFENNSDEHGYESVIKAYTDAHTTGNVDELISIIHPSNLKYVQVPKGVRDYYNNDIYAYLEAEVKNTSGQMCYNKSNNDETTYTIGDVASSNGELDLEVVNTKLEEYHLKADDVKFIEYTYGVKGSKYSMRGTLMAIKVDQSWYYLLWL